jgi:carbamoyl-phosphate synthase large subunit
VSRSSALASKATGFPIAKIAAKLAVGFTLDEIPNDITRKTPASFEPTIDYVVAKIPKWQFEKFPGADRTLGTEMRSVGEVMAIGRTFKEALLKGMHSLETGKRFSMPRLPEEMLRRLLTVPTPERLGALFAALRQGMSQEEICRLTAMDPWFIRQLADIVALEQKLTAHTLENVPAELLREAKRYGFRRAPGRAVERRGSSSAAAPAGAGVRSSLQARGHLRGGVRVLHALPLLYLRG